MKKIENIANSPSSSPLNSPLKKHVTIQTPTISTTPLKAPIPPSDPKLEFFESPYQKYEAHLDELSEKIAKLKEDFDKKGFSDQEVDFYPSTLFDEKHEIASQFSIDEINTPNLEKPMRKTEMPQKTPEFESHVNNHKNNKLSESFGSGHKHQTSVGEFLLDLKDKILVNKGQIEELYVENQALKKENMGLIKTIDELNEGKHVTKVIENCQFPETHKNLETSFRDAKKESKEFEMKIEKYEEIIKEFKGEEFLRRIAEEISNENAEINENFRDVRSVSPIIRMEEMKIGKKRNSEGNLAEEIENFNIMETIAKRNSGEKAKFKEEIENLKKKLKGEEEKFKELKREKEEIEENSKKINEEYQEYLKNMEKVLNSHKKEEEENREKIEENTNSIEMLNKEKKEWILEKDRNLKIIIEKEGEILLKNQEIEKKTKENEEKNLEIEKFKQELASKIL